MRSIADLLVDAGLVTPEQRAWAEAQPGGAPSALLSAGIVTEIQLVGAAAERAGVPFIDLDADEPPFEAAALLDPATARSLRIVPVRRDAGAVVVAMADPTDQRTCSAVESRVGGPVSAVAAAPSAIARQLARLYPTQVPAAPTFAGSSGSDLDLLLAQVVRRGGSDLHLSAGRPPGVRVHGEIWSLDGEPPLTAQRIEQLVHSALTDDQRRRFERELELDLSYQGPTAGRFRMNVFIQQGVIGAVMRAIPTEIPEFSSLGLPAPIAGLAALHRGLVLVTGPTGSGKSTTLASLVDIVNRTRRAHIMTVEDPIEFVHVHRRSVVNQREVGNDTLTFASALKHVLRQDPDVILVGEMRDLETISTALTAAETGHLVFGTLHTQSASQSIDRIVDVFPAHQQAQIRTQLATTIRGIVSQQLVPTVRGGRVCAAEVLIANTAIRAMIRDGKTHQIISSMQSGAKLGMQTMDQALATLVKDGRITIEVAQEHCHDEDDLRRLAGVSSGAVVAPVPVGKR